MLNPSEPVAERSRSGPMPAPPVELRELGGEAPALSPSDLVVGREFGPRRFVADAVTVRRYRVASTGSDSGTDEVPAVMLCSAGVVKAVLGGRWPDSTVHVRQRLRRHARLAADEVFEAAVTVSAADWARERPRVELRVDARRPGGGVIQEAVMTLYWADAEAPESSRGR